MATPKFTLFLLSVLLPSLSAHAQKSDFFFIRNADFSNIPKSQRAEIHQKMTKLFVELEKKEKFPKFYKSRFSHKDPVRILDQLSNYLIDQSIANDNGQACLFGGWPSRRNGRCSVPWSSESRSVAGGMDSRAYDSNSYCGDDNLFRCNPLVFGPGIDQGMVGDDFPNINGRRNNSAPYHAGICVDISQGYNGLSERCQAASERLDQIRRNHNMAPWRESDFFNEDTAAQFRGLQGLIADRCRENREQLNSDNMCTSLETSLGLTVAAVEAGQMDGMTPDELFPQCAGLRPPEPACDEGIHEDFANLRNALNLLKNEGACNFNEVQAIDTNSFGHSMSYDGNSGGDCRSPIQGALRASGLPDGGAPFTVAFFGEGGSQAGRIEIPSLTKEMTPSQIVEAIRNGDNSEAFANLCSNSQCPRTEDAHLENLYSALEELKGREGCNFGAVHATDPDTFGQDFFEPTSCGLAVDGRLATEGLPHTPSTRGDVSDFQEEVPIIISLRDHRGELISSLNINATSSMDSAAILSQIDQAQLDAACNQSGQTYSEDDSVALAALGITNPDMAPAFLREQAAELMVRAREQGIEDLQVEIGPNGEISLSSESTDIIALQERAPQLMQALTAEGQNPPTFEVVNGTLRLGNIGGESQALALANAGGADLNTGELAVVSEITDFVNLTPGDVEVTAVERAPDGTITLNTSGPTRGIASDEAFNGYRIREEEVADGRGHRLVLTPINSEAPPQQGTVDFHDPDGDGVMDLPSYRLNDDPDSRDQAVTPLPSFSLDDDYDSGDGFRSAALQGYGGAHHHGLTGTPGIEFGDEINLREREQLSDGRVKFSFVINNQSIREGSGEADATTAWARRHISENIMPTIYDRYISAGICVPNTRNGQPLSNGDVGFYVICDATN